MLIIRATIFANLPSNLLGNTLITHSKVGKTMSALIFTNTILGAYLSYIIAEKRKKAMKEKSFWLVLLLLITSVCITIITVVPTESIETVKDTMLP